MGVREVKSAPQTPARGRVAVWICGLPLNVSVIVRITAQPAIKVCSGKPNVDTNIVFLALEIFKLKLHYLT